MLIGEKIRALRIEKGMTQEELAKALGYKSRVSINKIELGRDGRTIKMSKIADFAKALDTSVDYLMGWEDDPNYQKGLAIGRAIASDETSIILEKIAQLSPEAKAELISFLDYLLSKNSVDNA